MEKITSVMEKITSVDTIALAQVAQATLPAAPKSWYM